jgi:hypothetical protein
LLLGAACSWRARDSYVDRVTQAAAALPAIAIAIEYAGSFVLPFDLSIARPLKVPLALGWAVLALTAVALAVHG